MARYKTVASTKNEFGQWIPQSVVAFTAEEEEMRDAEEELESYNATKPTPLTAEEEISLLIDKGAQSVKIKREEYKASLEAWELNRKPALEKFHQKNKA